MPMYLKCFKGITKGFGDYCYSANMPIAVFKLSKHHENMARRTPPNLSSVLTFPQVAKVILSCLPAKTIYTSARYHVYFQRMPCALSFFHKYQLEYRIE